MNIIKNELRLEHNAILATHSPPSYKVRDLYPHRRLYAPLHSLAAIRRNGKLSEGINAIGKEPPDTQLAHFPGFHYNADKKNAWWAQ